MSDLRENISVLLHGAWRRRYMIVIPMLVLPILGFGVSKLVPTTFVAHTSMLIHPRPGIIKLTRFQIRKELIKRLSKQVLILSWLTKHGVDSVVKGELVTPFSKHQTEDDAPAKREYCFQNSIKQSATYGVISDNTKQDIIKKALTPVVGTLGFQE